MGGGLEDRGVGRDLEQVRALGYPCFTGGTGPGEGNLISGSMFGIYANGRWHAGGTQRLTIQGNRIGTSADGQSALANFQGIYLDGYEGGDLRFEAHDILIGGTEPGAGNLVSGNQTGGIIVRGPNLTGVTIQHNQVGTDIDGLDALPNGIGVSIENASGVLVGGNDATARNVISGNADEGVYISGGTGNVVQGNYVGTNAAGSADLGNGGLGVFGIRLARGAREVFGVESDAGNIAFLKKNLALNGVGNFAVCEGTTEEWLEEILERQPGVVILDPPRRGVDPSVVKGLVDNPVPLLVYLSCNPTTLARDLKGLGAIYELRDLRVYDFFPRTPHIETLAVLAERR